VAKATFGAGCFWGVEAQFLAIPGVKDVTSGYSGGTVEDVSYEQVCTGKTGHAEVVEVEFDPSMVTYEQLVDVFFEIHDPTTLNRQGPDVGTQYRSAIFVHDDEQKIAALRAKAEWQARSRKPIVTEIEPAGPFWAAEDYHQRYFEKTGRACHVPYQWWEN